MDQAIKAELAMVGSRFRKRCAENSQNMFELDSPSSLSCDTEIKGFGLVHWVVV